jgi:hypothetical protein
VITTKEAPMTEVAGAAGFYIPSKSTNGLMPSEWLTKSVKVVEEVISLSDEKRKIVIDAGLENANRFNTESALDQIEEIYKRILSWS